MDKDKVKLWIAKDPREFGGNYFVFKKRKDAHFHGVNIYCGWAGSGLDFLIICREEFEKKFPKSFHLKGGPKSLIQIEIRRIK